MKDPSDVDILIIYHDFGNGVHYDHVVKAHRKVWPIPTEERAALARLHEPAASSSPDGYRLATCVVCSAPMVAMWHLWLDDEGLKKEIHMCARCATDVYGAPPITPEQLDVIDTQVIDDPMLDVW